MNELYIDDPMKSLVLTSEAIKTVYSLFKEYNGLEFGGFLEIVKVDSDSIYLDFVIVKQEVASASVDYDEIAVAEYLTKLYKENRSNQLIGTLHSHNSMGTFFSGTDNACINEFIQKSDLFKLQIVISQHSNSKPETINDIDFKGQIENIKYIYHKHPIYYLTPETWDLEENKLKEYKKMITEKAYTASHYYTGWANVNYHGYWDHEKKKWVSENTDTITISNQEIDINSDKYFREIDDTAVTGSMDTCYCCVHPLDNINILGIKYPIDEYCHLYLCYDCWSVIHDLEYNIGKNVTILCDRCGIIIETKTDKIYLSHEDEILCFWCVQAIRHEQVQLEKSLMETEGIDYGD